MLNQLTVKGFKSLLDVSITFPRLTVLFGPNAAGKSNLLDAIQALSRLASSRTVGDALSEPIRGYPAEAFAFPPNGLAGVLQGEARQFEIGCDFTADNDKLRYRVCVEYQPATANLVVADEYLTGLSRTGEPKDTPAIEVVDDHLRLRRRDRGRPRVESIRQNFTYLSDVRLGGSDYKLIERARRELSGWRTYYLDPRVAMRRAQPPSEVRDIGVLGESIASFLYRLQAEHPKRFDAIKRTLRSIVPSVEELVVDLDKRRGTLDILVRQGGTEYSSRIVSEGTLRVLALCSVVVNPWGGSLLAFEEPENGVHPRRIELIAQLLVSLANQQGRQVVVTTHSPLFCEAVLRLARGNPDALSLLAMRRRGPATSLQPFNLTGPLFAEDELSKALTAPTEDGRFETLVLRGYLDE